MNRQQELGAIASKVQAVLLSFQSLAAPATGETGSSGLRQIITGFEDEMIRFKMWTGNLGAHQSGRASLDHRLREAPHLQEQVVYLLTDICESLQDALALICDEPPSWHRDPLIVHDKDDEDEKVSLDYDSDSGFTDSDDGDVSPKTGLSTIHTDVGEAIDCLLRLSVAIANPAPHERVRKLGADPSEDVSYYETYDINYVRDKFPKISAELADSLGKFITRRRQFFKYREAHHTRLAQGLESTQEADTSRTEIVPKTVASSLPEFVSNLQNIDLRAGVIDEDDQSEMGMSQTSYATSAGFLAEEVDGQMQTPPPPLRVPPLPSAAERGVFECPFCYRMVSASTWAAWKRHIFGDLRPYTCLFSGCVESNKDFDRRHHWQLHVSQYHLRSWFCPFKCEGTFPSTLDLKQHMSQIHLSNAPEEQLDAIINLGEKSASKDDTNQCPLCACTMLGLKPYVKHVGRHLEQLALYALSGFGHGDLEEDGQSDEQNSAASEVSVNDADSFEAPSTSPSLRRRLQEPVTAFVENLGSSEEIEELETANAESLLDPSAAIESTIKMANMVSEFATLQVIEGKNNSAERQMEIEQQIREEAEEAFRERMEAMRIAQERAQKQIKEAETEAKDAAVHRTVVENMAEWERSLTQPEARRRAQNQANFNSQAELEPAELAHTWEDEARALAQAEAKYKFEAEIRADETREKNDVEERARAEVEARRKLEAELEAAEELREHLEEAGARSEQLVMTLIETTLKADAEATVVAKVKAAVEAALRVRTLEDDNNKMEAYATARLAACKAVAAAAAETAVMAKAEEEAMKNQIEEFKAMADAEANVTDDRVAATADAEDATKPEAQEAVMMKKIEQYGAEAEAKAAAAAKAAKEAEHHLNMVEDECIKAKSDGAARLAVHKVAAEAAAEAVATAKAVVQALRNKGGGNTKGDGYYPPKDGSQD
ncbi:hypothetical protein G7Z17_g3535 [Cylindrodendrum hubeiense]|uniref:C2H2-type domain-containing protein n=1 Tax=Cylindrodendrum hubeiense TaxID=595255 RepID=A0A9P5HHP4_9HYPO|nr:hypothetical protein G7Z17_g3535 [Cylindrodendrum hubeiense]